MKKLSLIITLIAFAMLGVGNITTSAQKIKFKKHEAKIKTRHHTYKVKHR